MTAADTKVLRWASGLVLALLVPTLIALASGAWSSKESVQDHNADIAAIRSDVRRILDVICADKPTVRQCKEKQ